jgi:hypothetical protein
VFKYEATSKLELKFMSLHFYVISYITFYIPLSEVYLLHRHHPLERQALQYLQCLHANAVQLIVFLLSPIGTDSYFLYAVS